MPGANFDFPGVVVTEAVAGAIPIERLGFKTVKFVGTALRGPVNKPTLITSQRQFVAIFGPRTSTSYLHDAIRQHFENVRAPSYVVRVVGATGAITATKMLTKAGPVSVLKIDALGSGADANYVASPAHGISVTYVGGLLSVFDAGVLIEQYHGVTFDNAQKSAQYINGHSNLIQITWLDMTSNPDDVSAPTGLLTGADGTAVTAAQIVGSESANPRTGIYAFADKAYPLGFHIAPGWTTNAVGNALIDVATRFRGLALIDSTFGNSTAQAITEKQTYASSHGYALYIYGWVQMTNPDTGALAWVPRSPIRAAHIIRSHSQPGGIANVGAGVDSQLRNIPYDPQNGAYGLETDQLALLDDLTHGELNRNGIDVARNFAREGYGIVHWSARTISPEVLFRFLHVRVLLNVIAESIELGLKPYVFQVVDGRGNLASRIKATIDQLLWDLWNDDSLFGATAGDAFNVKLQSSLAELEQGIIQVEVYVKPVPIAERINVTLFRVALGFNFKTGEVTIGNAELKAAA